MCPLHHQIKVNHRIYLNMQLVHNKIQNIVHIITHIVLFVMQTKDNAKNCIGTRIVFH